MQCGINYMKQQKILALKVQNEKLNKQIENLLKNHQIYSEQSKSNNINITNYITQIQIEQMRQQILKTTISTAKIENQQVSNKNNKLTEQLTKIENQNGEINQKLHQLNKEKQQFDNFVGRVKKQLRMYDGMGSNNSNLVKMSNSLKKRNECLLRQFNVMKNKLQSHKKYLNILQKKERKQKKQQQQNKNPNFLRKINSSTNIKFPLRNERINCEFQKEQQKNMQVNKKKIKQFDELTRKKNQLLSKNKI